MNNEDKRFKQINRIAKPIQVEDSNQNKLEPPIPPKQKPPKKTPKKINIETIFKGIIGLLSLACTAALVFLIFISVEDKTTSNLKYNDAKTTEKREEYFINASNLSEGEYYDTPGTFNLNNFIFTLTSNGTSLSINVNGKTITTASRLGTKVGFVDDLVMFTTQNIESRTTTLFIVDASGTLVKSIYNYDDIDGMVLTNSNAVNFDTKSIILSFSRVSDSMIYNSNTIGNNLASNICDEDDLFKNSIETQKPAKLNYYLEYLGNHNFSEPTIIYEESIDEYKSNNNLCH